MAKVVKLKIGSKFYAARPPKASMSNTSINSALNRLAAGEVGHKRLSDSKKCLVVFFRRGAKVTATQRCEGRKLPRKRNPNQCRGANNLFAKCGTRGSRKRRKK